jgi:ketosteroid isomerase-like protein
VLAWRDVLHDGPVPPADAAELRRVRAEHLAGRGWGGVREIEGQLAARDRLLEEHASGEVVLWFEADLYDQLQLVQVLDALSRLGADPARITLVSVGEYPGIAHFGGLGELRADQLAPLARDGQRLSGEALELAAAAWSAFTAPDPGGMPAIARARSPVLRHLGEGFARLLEEYPSRTDGLSRTQRRILLAAADGEASAAAVFERVWVAERRPFLADELCWALVRELAAGPAPLLVVGDPGQAFPRRRLRLTTTGEEALAGRLDHVRRNGIDRWIGGVHLAGHSTPWRYDDRLERLLPAPRSSAEIVARYFEMWNTGDSSIAGEVLDPAWVDHAHPEVAGPRGVRQAVERVRAARPELAFQIEAVLGEGDLVAAVGQVHRGPASSDQASRLIWLVRLRDGRMSEMWTFHDSAPGA